MSHFHCDACGHTDNNPSQCPECKSRNLTKVVLAEVQCEGLIKGPILHEALRPDLLERLRQIWAYLGPFDKSAFTFEQFEIDFLRDCHPEREIKVWEAMATVHREYMDRRPKADPKKVFAQVMLASNGRHDGSQMGQWIIKRIKRLGGIVPLVISGSQFPVPQSQPLTLPRSRPAGDGQHRHGNH